jgi:hypothetical protein
MSGWRIHSGEDWFEIYNWMPPVELSGLFLTDDLNNRTQSPILALSLARARMDT